MVKQVYIRERLGRSQDAVLKRLRRAGGIAAALGFLLAACSAAMALMAIIDPGEVLAGQMDLVGLAALWLAVAAQTALGFLLFFAGLSLRRRQEWARRILLAVVWFLIAYCVAFVVFWEVGIAVTTVRRAETLVSMAMGAAIIGFWLLILWRPKRYLSSADVKEACSRPTDPDARARSRRRAIVLAALLVALVLGAPLVVYMRAFVLQVPVSLHALVLLGHREPHGQHAALCDTRMQHQGRHHCRQ